MSATSTLIRIGIIGCGNIAPQYARTLTTIDWIELAAVSDGQPGRADKFAQEYGTTAVEIAAMLADPTIVAVVNLTPAHVHATVTRSILTAGKHAYSEKPLGIDFAEGQSLLELATNNNVRVGCAPDTFLGAGLQTARDAIDKGLIGEPLAANGFMLGFGPEWWHPNPEIFYGEGAGPMFDMGPYYLTALVHLLGPASGISSVARIGIKDRVIHAAGRVGDVVQATVPTHVSSLIEFASGPTATLVTSFDVKASRYRNIEIYGSEATLSVPDPNTFGGPVSVRGVISGEWRDLPLVKSSVPQQRGIGLADMLSGINHNRPHRASGDMALHVLELMNSSYASSDAKRRIDLTTTCERPAVLPTKSTNGYDE
jgi:predicted dehydrogenase